MSIMQLLDMYRFYTYLLDIPDVSIRVFRVISITLTSDAALIGRHPNHLVARGCTPNRQNT